MGQGARLKWKRICAPASEAQPLCASVGREVSVRAGAFGELRKLAAPELGVWQQPTFGGQVPCALGHEPLTT
ncbi:MAG: hypothetical protein SGPRY_007191 [Prymnesium sp.]